MNSKRGITLLETVVVSAIVLAVATTIGFAVKPSSERSRIQAKIESDLHEAGAAINIYRQDNDGGLPLYFDNPLGRDDSLPALVPRRFPNWPKKSVYDLGVGVQAVPGTYYYTMPPRVQEYFRRSDAINHIDVERIPIVKAPFFVRSTGPETFLYYEYPSGSHLMKRDGYSVLGSFLDGSVRWVPWREPFEDEFAAYSYKLRQTVKP
jgi:hypothetical protein